MKKVLVMVFLASLVASCDILLTIDDDIDSNDSIATADSKSESSWTGTIASEDDVDYYKIYCSGGYSYTFDVSGFSGDVDIALYNADGVKVDSSASSSATTETVTVNVTNSAYYYLKVYPYGTSAAGTSYTVTKSSTVLSDGNDTIADADYINYSISGTIDSSSDVDYYKRYLYAGNTYVISLSNLTADADLKLYDTNGTTVLASSIHAGTAVDSVTNTVVYEGYYYFKVYPASSTTYTPYTLNVTL